MSRRTRTSVPVATKLLQCRAVPGTDIKEKLISKRQNAKKYYDHGTKELSQLSVGQSVRIRLGSGSKEPWAEGICLRQVAPQSYEIKTKLGVFRRNRQMIRAEPQPRPLSPEPSVTITSSDDTSRAESLAVNDSLVVSDTPLESKLSSEELIDTNDTAADVSCSEQSNTSDSPADSNTSVKQSRSGRTVRRPPDSFAISVDTVLCV